MIRKRFRFNEEEAWIADGGKRTGFGIARSVVKAGAVRTL